uniref:Uncharacterized protein n=1 Tax=Siphoviridae sp. ctg0K17 TaxID=2825600 RepID=A0A8S5PX68_9CAUD|nr:MAG TPA: hypothetical protein [Siphoviridae sp. ctg0K17]
MIAISDYFNIDPAVKKYMSIIYENLYSYIIYYIIFLLFCKVET